MPLALTLAYVLHTLFAGLWVGAVAFTAWKVVPAAKAGDATPESLAAVAGGLSTLTRVAALLFLATGGYMAATVYGSEGLFAPPRGHLVLTMLGLWIVMTGLVEVATSRIDDATAENKVRTGAREAGTLLTAAAGVGVVLLCIGGYLVAPPL
ncbi:CopD family protein [Candidatus Halobonum tyrrellensis]|uniref:Copper resistance protein D domain-containing protein n=1 Tax=Candidatus Halobonum tyrrellensis G22 TaxID=1324957 RepID=V4GSK1_9EURY|nr:CopD family protein [Candidatus Halobonum tyrrellensis]ESP88071.1 hypothetical protein K933_10994 [Candidatus Halobonum tyrrellensis G22]